MLAKINIFATFVAGSCVMAHGKQRLHRDRPKHKKQGIKGRKDKSFAATQKIGVSARQAGTGTTERLRQ